MTKSAAYDIIFFNKTETVGRGPLFMRSIRTKIIILTVSAIVISMAAAAVLSVITIRDIGNDSSDQILSLLCQTGEKNLNAYFDSIEKSVKVISEYADDDLTNLGDDTLENHVQRVETIFSKTARNTAGILTYYYRIDPTVSETEKGFWYVRSENDEFNEHEVTDITKYDTSDQSKLVWFTVPKTTGKTLWLPPYFTENLGAYVFSYNTPVYKDNAFIGVIGIEIDYNTIAQEVNNITLYDNGYAFINDSDGNVIYHPKMNMSRLTGKNTPKVPDGLLSKSHSVRYTFEEVEKQAYWSELNNGMRLNVSVPVSEINKGWKTLLNEAVLISAALLVIFIILTLHISNHIAKPLKKLTNAALEVDKGNYDVKFDYEGKDEVGILTNTFGQLVGHLKSHIDDLNQLIYSDALTSVRNKGAFDVYVRKLQNSIDNKETDLRFSIAILDCDNLKTINDKHGHQKGNSYLKASVSLICQVFHHSPVFRIGGDEFAVILMNEDYRKRNELACLFEKKCSELRDILDEDWEQISVSLGMSDYDPEKDKMVADVIKRADDLMYQNKRNRKAKS